MSASSVALPQPTPAQLARGIAGAVPGELSKSPLLGIVGVIIGAGVVTLTSRMISLGLSDFKGHRGFGYDASAWIGTAFDIGLMFIGPLTFALRNIPLRYLPFTIALYASSVDGAVNIAPSLYGWYRDHLSWQWMFWNSAVITPLMMACIYFGIPESPAPKRSG